MSERDYDVLCAVTTKKQTAYGTARGDGDLTVSYPFLGADLLEEDLGFRTNEEETGHGEFPTRQDQELKDCRVTRRFDAGTFMLGWAAAFGMGAVSSVQQETTTAYKHTFTPQTAKQLPVTTEVEQQSSGIKLKVRDVAVARFKISGENPGRLKLEIEKVGSGHVETSTLSMPSLSADAFLRMHSAQLEVGVSASEVDVSARWKRFEFEWNNNPLLDDGYFPNSGQVRGRLEHGRRTSTLSFDLLLDANAVERTHLLANNTLRAILTATGANIESTYNNELIITVESLKYRALPIGVEDNMQVYRVETVILDDGTNPFVQLDVTNTQTEYLATS